MELGGSGLFALRGFKGAGSHDLNRRLANSVTRRQFSVHLLNGAAQSQITVLLVHIVCSTTGVVTELHSEILDVVGVLFEDLMNFADLSVGFFDPLQKGHVVPKSGTCHH